MFTELDALFNEKLTENGDLAYKSSTSPLVDILFSTPYLEKHLGEVSIGNSNKEKLFSMFIRDPRNGLGRRDLGRELMKQSGVPANFVPQVGRYDDLYELFGLAGDMMVLEAATQGDALAAKWLPRYTSGKKAKARAIAIMKSAKLTIREYQAICKTANTVEQQLNEHVRDANGNVIYTKREFINFEHVPSLARIKWSRKFYSIPSYELYLEQVKKGEAKMNFSVGTSYDIYKALNSGLISSDEADLMFKQLKPVNISCIPIIDVSGSMHDSSDSIGKALSIGIQLSRNSTYCNGQFITFSSVPQLQRLKGESLMEQTVNLLNADWGMSTDLGAVFRLLGKLESYPDYLVVLSDMEFDRGSRSSKDALMASLAQKGIETKIIWWNFNSRSMTFPETDKYGNFFMSGYSPQLLELLNHGMDANSFLDAMLSDYAKKLV